MHARERDRDCHSLYKVKNEMGFRVLQVAQLKVGHLGMHAKDEPDMPMVNAI
jgi:hypothetical protein